MKSSDAERIVIVPDDEHNHAAGEELAELYRIPACQRLVLTRGDYTFPVPEEYRELGANSIHLIPARERFYDSPCDEYFRAAWDGSADVQLGAAELVNLKGTKPFEGFVSGESYTLGIGYDNYPSEQLAFAVMWACIIEVL